MSDKDKKFNPPVGYMVAVQHQMVMVTRLATVLGMNPVELGKKLEESGHQLQPDPFDISADSWKVMDIESKKAKPDLQVVPE